MTASAENPPRLLPYGDGAFLVEFADIIDRSISEHILHLNQQVRLAKLPGLLETVPTFRSLLVRYDAGETSFGTLSEQVMSLHKTGASEPRSSRHWQVPVCYEPDFAPDLADVADATGMSSDEVVKLHVGVTYHIYMIGFVAGYPYLGDLPEALSLPRRSDPRLRVPAGSIAIALTMAAIYPLVSPGGWHLIGRTPIKLFDPGWQQPALFAPGDSIDFVPIDAARFEELLQAVETENYQIEPQVAAA